MTHDAGPEDLANLRKLSAALGSNPLLIQAAGGNTSIKQDETMWIKASGTLLADALTHDIFVPTDWRRLHHALTSDLAAADRPQDFIMGNGALRPSIETSLHAVFPQKVVLHAHCVNTIAHAIRCDGIDLIAPKMRGLKWAFVPYVKPGANLAAKVAEAMGDGGLEVAVLGNHGLIVAAETVDGAADLLRDVARRLTVMPAELRPPRERDLAGMGEGLPYAPADCAITHQPALRAHLFDAATAGSLYPDHVIFLGDGVPKVQGSQDLSDLLQRHAGAGLPLPPLIAVAELGMLVHEEASSSALALAQCLGNVLLRLPEGAAVNHLSAEDADELLNWDAEKYRRALNHG